MPTIYTLLNNSHSLYLISEGQVTSFQALAAKHRNLSCLLGHNEIDLYAWRIAMDLFFLLQNTMNKPIYLAERGMISPIQHFYIKFIVENAQYQKLLHTTTLTDHNCFIFAIYFATTFKKCCKQVLNGRSEKMGWANLLGDLFDYTNTLQTNVNHLPLELLEMQAKAIRVLKTYMTQDDSLQYVIDQTIIEAKKLCYVLSSQFEEEIGWKTKQFI